MHEELHFLTRSMCIIICPSCVTRESSSIVYNSEYLSAVTPPLIEKDPCVPSPCGSFSQCRSIGGSPACTCLENYIGQPPNCRPECTIHSECANDKACINMKCVDPCPGSCGTNAQCSVINHIPTCRCPEGYTGNTFILCEIIATRKPSRAIQYATYLETGIEAQFEHV